MRHFAPKLGLDPDRVSLFLEPERDASPRGEATAGAVRLWPAAGAPPSASLIVHELAHVAQHANRTRRGAVADQTAAEAEAAALAAAVQSGAPLWMPRNALPDGRRAYDKGASGITPKKPPTPAVKGQGWSGTFSVTTQHWSHPELPADGSRERYGMVTEISFIPGFVTSAWDTEIAFVQVVRRIKLDGSDVPGGVIATDRETTRFWYVDANLGEKQGWYGYSGDDPRADIKTVPWVSSQRKRWAHMRDTPGGHTGGERFEAESAAVAKSGIPTGFIYGAVTWGFEADVAGNLTELPVKIHSAASGDFIEACGKWNEQARAPKGFRNADDQAELPSMVNLDPLGYPFPLAAYPMLGSAQ